MHTPLFYRLRAWRREVAYISYALLVVLVASLCVVLPARAVEQSSEMTVSPTSQRIELTPGTTTEGEFTVLNSAGQEPLNVSISVAPYQVKNEQYEPSFEKDTNWTQLSHWVKFSQDYYTIAPGAKATVKYSIQVPQDVPDGGQYAVVLVEAAAADLQGTGVSAQKRIGTLLYGRMKGTTREAGNASFRLPQFLQLGDHISMSAISTNTGNVDYDATVSYAVKSVFGGEVAKDSRVATVIPDSKREIPFEWKDQPLFGVYNVAMSSKQAGTTNTANSWIVVVHPIVAIGLVLGVIGLIILVIYLRRRRY